MFSLNYSKCLGTRVRTYIDSVVVVTRTISEIFNLDCIITNKNTIFIKQTIIIIHNNKKKHKEELNDCISFGL